MMNNLILWACMSANDEGLRLGEALGVDAEKLRAALHHSSAQNWSMDTRAEQSGMPWAEKDMNIVLQEADHARLSLPALCPCAAPSRRLSRASRSAWGSACRAWRSRARMRIRT